MIIVLPDNPLLWCCINETFLLVLQAPGRAATRASKQAEKGKAVASAPGSPPSKGKAAAKRAAEPVSQAEKSPKKAAKRSNEPPTPAKAAPAPVPAASPKQPVADVTKLPGKGKNPGQHDIYCC